MLESGIAEDSPLFEATVIDLALTQDSTIIDTANATEVPTSVLEVSSPVTTGSESEDPEEPSVGEETPIAENEVTAFRFFSSGTESDFYTTDEAEIDFITENLGNYDPEGAAYRVLEPITGDRDNESSEIDNVYRFFNPSTGSHLYTANEVERDFIVDNFSNLNFEGAKFAAYNTDLGEDTIPVYRFYNPTTGIHVFTQDDAQQTSLEGSDDYNSEGIAFHVIDLDV